MQQLLRFENAVLVSELNLNMFGRHLLSSTFPPACHDVEVMTEGANAIGTAPLSPQTPKAVTYHEPTVT